MNGDYLVIDKKVLPEVYEKVITTKKILQEDIDDTNGEYDDIRYNVNVPGVE